MTTIKQNSFLISGIDFLKQKSDPGLTDKKYKISRKQAYWLSQVSGWFLYVLANIIFIASFDRSSTARILIVICLGAVGILLTHLYRRFIINKNWLELSLIKIIPRILISSVSLGIIIYGILLSAYLVTGVTNFEELKIASPLIGVFNFSSVILLWNLIYFFIHFFENYQRAEIESYIWEAAVKDFELKTLKSQLNPHFMFNAMNSIRALIEEEPQSAKDAVTKLSNILRYSLKIERNETVALEEEIRTVKYYLDLETIRYEERLKYKLQIAPESENAEIPPMMIQTLVENGIKHGISKQTNGGEVCVNSEVVDSELHIKIKNTGSINEEDLKHAIGFGIANTKHRLNLLYGENAKFKIENLNSNEVLAEIIIPTGGIKNESLNSR